jgi:threonine/homoserine/homoserine lactone efflux protein
MLALSAVFMALTFAVFAGYAVAAATLRHRLLSRPAVVRRMRQVFAASFAALGLRLAITPQT